MSTDQTQEELDTKIKSVQPPPNDEKLCAVYAAQMAYETRCQQIRLETLVTNFIEVSNKNHNEMKSLIVTHSEDILLVEKVARVAQKTAGSALWAAGKVSMGGILGGALVQLLKISLGW